MKIQKKNADSTNSSSTVSVFPLLSICSIANETHDHKYYGHEFSYTGERKISKFIHFAVVR